MVLVRSVLMLRFLLGMGAATREELVPIRSKRFNLIRVTTAAQLSC